MKDKGIIYLALSYYANAMEAEIIFMQDHGEEVGSLPEYLERARKVIRELDPDD